MRKSKNELVVPPKAKKDSNACEIARVWIANDNLHVSLKVDIWDNPFIWGMLLADLAQHVANSYMQIQGWDRIETLHRIRQGFDAEMDSPTDQATGKVLD